MYSTRKGCFRVETRVARFFLTQYDKTGENIPNCHLIIKSPYKIFKMAVIYSNWIYLEYTNLFPFQGPPKFTRIGIFGFENKSANPG
jgi:hypothetical protein